MAFTISNIQSAGLLTMAGVRLEGRGRPSGTSSELSSISDSEATSRYRLSSLQKDQIELQKKSTRAAIVLQAVEQTARDIRNDSVGKETLETLRQAGLDGKSSPIQISDPALTPVVTSDPPQAGRFTLRIFGGTASGDSMSYRLELENIVTKQIKTLETTIQPVTGLIEGIALHIQEPPPAQVDVHVAESSNYPLPDLIAPFKKAMDSGDYTEVREILDTLQTGLEDYQSGIRNDFVRGSLSQENMRAASPDIHGMQEALNVLAGANEAMLKNSSSSLQMFSHVSAGQTSNLLEE